MTAGQERYMLDIIAMFWDMSCNVDPDCEAVQIVATELRRMELSETII